MLKALQKALMDSGINAEVEKTFYGYEIVVDGDWKHDHLAAKMVVKEVLGDRAVIQTVRIEDSDSDCYEATYEVIA